MARGRHTRRRRTGAIALIVAIAIGVMVLVFGGVAFAAYRYEMSHADRILPGVRIAGVDVGGMTRADATRAVRAAVGTQLEQQITVTVGSDHWTTTLGALGRRAAISDAVDGAFSAAHDLTTLSRAWHRLRDSSVGVDVPLDYRTAGAGVDHWVAQIADDVEVAPRNASIGIASDASGIVMIHAKPGEKLAQAAAATAVRRALDQEQASVRLHMRDVAPKVTDDKLGRTIVVHLDRNVLDLYDGFHVIRSYDVATAKPGFTTPNGDWTIYDEQVDPTWHNPAPDGWGAGEPLVVGPGPGNPMGPRAFYLTAPGLIRIHGTSDDASIGRYASHGCIRMHNTDVVALYPLVPVGTHVLVVGHRPADASYWDTPPGKDT
jgi:lipoprotein-anchoring transpeptidase ErfK/SrfK